MNTIRLLKRTTAIAAVAALPLTPMLAHAESAQVTGTQPPTAEENQAADQQKNQTPMQAGAPTTNPEEVGARTLQQEAESGATADEQQVQAGAQPTQSELVPSDKEIDVYKSQKDSAAEGATVTKKDGQYVEGAEGAAEQGGTAEQQVQAGEGGEDTHPANETGIVVEGKEGTQSGDAPDKAPTDDQAGLGEAGQAAAGQDALVATVGDREIRQSDIVGVISMLPPELRQQPAEMLVPIALDQLVMRELILQEAQKAGLESDPAVENLGTDAPEQAKEDAMVQAWLSEELGKAVTEQKVEETYSNLKQQFGDQAPPMETIRPQIEQELRQQAFMDLSKELQKDAEVTLYGPDGEPMEEQGGQSSTQ